MLKNISAGNVQIHLHYIFKHFSRVWLSHPPSYMLVTPTLSNFHAHHWTNHILWSKITKIVHNVRGNFHLDSQQCKTNWFCGKTSTYSFYIVKEELIWGSAICIRTWLLHAQVALHINNDQSKWTEKRWEKLQLIMKTYLRLNRSANQFSLNRRSLWV